MAKSEPIVSMKRRNASFCQDSQRFDTQERLYQGFWHPVSLLMRDSVLSGTSIESPADRASTVAVSVVLGCC
jgi:hypothetical protein